MTQFPRHVMSSCHDAILKEDIFICNIYSPSFVIALRFSDLCGGGGGGIPPPPCPRRQKKKPSKGLHSKHPMGSTVTFALGLFISLVHCVCVMFPLSRIPFICTRFCEVHDCHCENIGTHSGYGPAFFLKVHKLLFPFPFHA